MTLEIYELVLFMSAKENQTSSDDCILREFILDYITKMTEEHTVTNTHSDLQWPVSHTC